MTCYEYTVTEQVYIPLIRTTSSVIKNVNPFIYEKCVREGGRHHKRKFVRSVSPPF